MEYLEYVYQHRVKIKQIHYIFSPPLLDGGYLNKSSDTVILEPFEFYFCTVFILLMLKISINDCLIL